MSIKVNAKINNLCEAVEKSIQEGRLEREMDILRLQAAELGLSDEDLNKIIDEKKDQVKKNIKEMQIVNSNKKYILAICAGLILVEWIIGLWAGLSFFSVIIILLINLLTIAVIVFGVAYLLNRKK